MTKRELYTILFPEREARNSNRHYTRFTLPALLKVQEIRQQKAKEIEDEINSSMEEELW